MARPLPSLVRWCEPLTKTLKYFYADLAPRGLARRFGKGAGTGPSGPREEIRCEAGRRWWPLRQAPQIFGDGRRWRFSLFARWRRWRRQSERRRARLRWAAFLLCRA